MKTELDRVPELKNALKKHFDSIVLPSSLSARLEQGLGLATPPPYAVSKTRGGFFKIPWSLPGIKIFATGLAACFVGILVGVRLQPLGEGEPSFDPLVEVTSSAGRGMPADFDLDGDLAALPDMIRDILPGEPFLTAIPSHLVSEYDAKDGRFFSWSGMPGVKVSVRPKRRLGPVGASADSGAATSWSKGLPPFQQGAPAPSLGLPTTVPPELVANGNSKDRHEDAPSTLSIFKLPEGNKRRLLPQSRVTQAVRLSQGDRKIKFWRDEGFGYTLVSPLAAGESFTTTGDDKY